MSKITVEVSKQYDILVADNLLERTGEELRTRFPKARQIMLVADDVVEGLYGGRVMTSLEMSGFTVHKYVFPHGETSKTFATMIPLVERMAELAMTRTDLIVALGGGVTGDMAGFAAAIYLRGIDFVQIENLHLKYQSLNSFRLRKPLSLAWSFLKIFLQLY
ncbi:MAG: iron-containing alcohol dehydrogenase [Lachnospiraceae bacterium]|nr:iron-containing alcohol dehydrogenase [Lachnospiraceae bacterium]